MSVSFLSSSLSVRWKRATITSENREIVGKDPLGIVGSSPVTSQRSEKFRIPVILTSEARDWKCTEGIGRCSRKIGGGTVSGLSNCLAAGLGNAEGYC